MSRWKMAGHIGGIVSAVWLVYFAAGALSVNIPILHMSFTLGIISLPVALLLAVSAVFSSRWWTVLALIWTAVPLAFFWWLTHSR